MAHRSSILLIYNDSPCAAKQQYEGTDKLSQIFSHEQQLGPQQALGFSA
jgi:hypothetical protein